MVFSSRGLTEVPGLSEGIPGSWRGTCGCSWTDMFRDRLTKTPGDGDVLVKALWFWEKVSGAWEGSRVP